MKMIKRSLNTYMNAWTGPDFTAYPFSTYNEKDFNNNSHLNQASYLKWNEYCTTKIKNFIKHV